MGRSPCCDKNGLKKGPWTPEEDQMLVDFIQKHGYGNWRTLPKNAGLARCGKSCRLRWTNYLRPDIKRGRFSLEEEETIIQLHSILGNKWSAIASRLPGRTDNEIKNYWNTHIRKRLLRMGIDPVTHAPRLDLLELSSLLNSSLYNPTAQLGMSRLIALEPLVSSELLRMTANLLSSQCQNSNKMDQQVQFISTDHPQVQDQFALFHATQSGAHEVSPCSSISNSQLLGEAQLMRVDMDQLQQSTETNLWQEVAAFMPAGASNMIPDQVCNLGDHAINHNYNTSSVITTPSSSSPTTLNSSLTCWNNTSAEDDKDSYCSNMFKFPLPDLLDVGNYL